MRILVTRPEPYATRTADRLRTLGHDPAEEGDLRHLLHRVAGEMRALGKRVVAQLLHPARLLHQLFEAHPHIVFLREHAAQHHAELHFLHSLEFLSI